MSFPIRPLASYVVLKPKTQADKTASGILLTDSAKEKSDTLVVAAVADDVKAIKTGDTVVCKSYAGTNVTIDKVTYTLLKEEDIIAVLAEQEN